MLKTDKDGRILVYMITKRAAAEQPSYKNFKRCLNRLAEFCIENKISRVSFPKMAYGLDKMNWRKVVVLINKLIIDQGVHCSVYTNKSRVLVNSIRGKSDSVKDRIEILQQKDEEISKMKEKVESRKLKGFIIENNILLKLRRGKRGKIIRQLVVPEQLKSEVFRLCHDSFTGGHLGQFKTWRKLNARFYWPNVYQETINYVESCEVCAKLKSPPPNRPNLKPILEYEKPFDMLAVDVLELTQTTSGNKYALVFMDYLTRWAEVFPMKDMTSDTIARIFVSEIITRHGAPSRLLSDRG
jgi:hypothetical protein